MTRTKAPPGTRPATSPRRFSIVTGPLCEALGVQLSMSDEKTFTVEQGPDRWDMPVTIKGMGKPTNYLIVLRSSIDQCPPLAALLAGRLPASKSKNVEIHRIVAIVGRGADFTLNGGRLAAHHVSLNGGDNRAENLLTLSTAIHDRVHREAIDPDPAAYLASLEGSPTPNPTMTDELAALVAQELETYEGHSLPEPTPPEPEGEDDALHENPYNPVLNLLPDISLSFDTGEMVMTATYMETKPMRDKEGNTMTNEHGRPVTQMLWAPYTAVHGSALYLPSDELPEHLANHKRFHLEGLVAGEPRFSGTGIEAFVAGEPAPPDLAARVLSAFDRRVSFSRRAHLYILAAYMALTHVYPLATRCPLIALRSSRPGSGKTTTLGVATRLAFNAQAMGVSSIAVTVRLAALARGTLLLDEQETLVSREAGGHLIEVLNSRAEEETPVRNLDKAGNPQRFDIFGPALIANLSGLAPTLRSRSIEIEMEPAPPGDPRHTACFGDEDWLGLREGLLLWAGANWQSVKQSHDTDPAMRVGTNRHTDLWRLLLAVGSHFGGKEMFEILHVEATEAATPPANELEDALALGVAAAIADHFDRARRTQGGTQPFNVSLKFIHEAAKAALEADRHLELDSRQVGKFVRSLKLETNRSGRLKGATAVQFDQPEETLERLRADFPHLDHLLPEIPSSAS